VRACSESSMTSCSCGCGWTSKPTCRFAASPGVYEAVRLELRNDRGSEQGQVSLLSITSMTASNRRMASWRTRSRGTPAVGSTARAQSMPDRHPGLSSGRYRRPVECELGAARTCTAVEVRASRAARDDVAGPLASMMAVCLKRRMRDCLTPSPCRVDVAIRGRFRSGSATDRRGPAHCRGPRLTPNLPDSPRTARRTL